MRGHRIVHLDLHHQRPRQWNVLDDRNALGPRGLDNGLSLQPCPLGQHQRQRRFTLLIQQGHREVRGIGYHHGGLSLAAPATTANDLLVKTAPFALDLGRALRLLVLPLDFVLGHHLLLREQLALDEHVKSRDDGEDERG